MGSRSGKFYPIRTDNYNNMLTDVLSKFRAELEYAIQPLEKKMEELEAQLTQGAYSTSKELGPRTTVKWTGEWAEGFEPKDVMDMKDMYVATLQARRALYGYAMALESLGLPKEQKEAIRTMENMVTSAIRLYQTVMMIQEAITVFTAAGAFTPMGAFYLAAAGGMGLASLMYMGRAGGG